MREARQPSRVYTSAAQAAEALGLSLLGTVPAEVKLHSRAEGLAGLAPDPRISARIYRFLSGPAPVIWVYGLGQAGEELPVAVGVAERAAAAGLTPVLLVRPAERAPVEGDGRPVHAEQFAGLLAALLSGHALAEPTGLQGVMRAWAGGRAVGDPVVARSIVLAGEVPDDVASPTPETITHMVLVVPFRDCAAEDLERRVGALKAAGYPIVGMVGYGNEEPEPLESEAAPAPAVAKPQPERGPGPLPPRERVAVASPWSATFSPGRSGKRPPSPDGSGGRQRRRLPLFWWLVFAIGVLISIGVVFPGLVSRRSAQRQTVSIAERVEEDLGASRGNSPTVMEGEAIPAPAAGGTMGSPGAGDSASVPAADGATAPAGETVVAVPAADSVGAGEGESGVIPAPLEAVAEPEPAGHEPAGQEPAEQEPVGSGPAGQEPAVHAWIAGRGGPFTVLCGSFPQTSMAEAEIRRLAARGLETRVVRVEIPERGVWARVVAGRFDDKDSALAEAQAIVSAGHVRAAQVVAAVGAGPPVSRPIEREMP